MKTMGFTQVGPIFPVFQCLNLSKDTIVYSAHTKNEVQFELHHIFSIMQVLNEYFCF